MRSSPIHRHFLAWEEPLLPGAVHWLARDWAGAGPLDFSGQLVVVPTRQAGRRLRAGLAEWAAARGQAVFPPRVVTPDALLANDPAPDVASPLQTTLAWTEVFATLDLDRVRAVFPVDPPARNFSWALHLAGQFTALQSTLAEAGLTLDAVAARLPEDFAERARWMQLGELGRLHAAELARHGWREPQAARIAAAQSPAPLAGIERIVLLAVPDPLPLALVAVEMHARTVPVDVVVFAPPGEGAHFDSWGRPVAEAWAKRAAPLTDFEDRVHLLADPTAQAERLAALAAAHPVPDGVLGVGVADAEIVPLALNALERAGRAGFDPAGESRRQSALYHLLSDLAAFAREASFAHAVALARQPDVMRWLEAELGGLHAGEWLGSLDELWAEHLPATLAQARRHADGTFARALAKLDSLRERLRACNFAEATAAVLGDLFAARALSPERDADAALIEAAGAWTDILRECAAAANAFPGLAHAAWWEVSLSRFARQRTEREKPPGALEMQGWLELLWEDAPHLVVAGCNDGFVPDAVAGDVFLPESLRVRLGLKSNAARLARDAYLLHALVASRRAAGRVDLLLGKNSSAGDPLKPSRLLLLGDDADLPRRVGYLFRPLAAGGALPAWSRPWKLRPRRVAAPERIRVTALRAYLECPFRFYLRHVLRMEAVDATKNELDAFDFGTLCHHPLERLAEPPWRDCTDAALLAGMLLENFDTTVRARFGGSVAVPLVAQLESARQRLRRAAEVQARERAAGWVVVAVEREFQYPLGGVVIRGKIDRIDRHESSGAWRVLDYKTTDTARAPAETHLAPPRRDGGHEPWALCHCTGRERAWADLQLPLYLAALPLLDGLGVPPGERVACGYFNLPKAIGGTDLYLWEDYTPELHESAMRCADGIVAAIRAGKFWPPNEQLRPERDDFAELFHRGVAGSVAWEEEP